MADTNFDSVVATTFTGNLVGNVTGNITGAISATTGAFSGAVSLANGAVGTPSMTFTTDTDTGLYRVGANALAIVAGGAAILSVDASGFNGILGGTTPAAATVTALTASGASSLAALTATGTADLQGAVFALDNIETGITAHAGGTQGAAYALTKVISVISIVGTAADSVKLPAPTKVGQLAIIMNNAGANSLQVFGSGTDTINGVATATGVAQAAGKIGLYVATTTGAAAAWFRLLSA